MPEASEAHRRRSATSARELATNRVVACSRSPTASDMQPSAPSHRPATDINNNTVGADSAATQPDRNNNSASQHNSQRQRVKRTSLDMYDCKLICLATLIYHLALSLSASASMNLPDGIENILGFVPKSSFQCERDGYFGDIENDCRLFHLCQKQVHPNGRTEWRHWTYACGNQTMFNQLTLTCAFVDEAIPCKHASQFQYLNEVIHRPREPFLTDADVTSGFSYYSNRVMSDGARARAYEDSSLLAQLGGGGAHKIVASQPSSFESVSASEHNFDPNPSAAFVDTREESSNQAHNSISMQQLPLSQAFQTALGQDFSRQHRQAATAVDNGSQQFASLQLADPTNRHQSQAYSESMSPVASNLPEAARSAINEPAAQTTTPRTNPAENQHLSAVQTQSESKPTEAFNFVLTTNHQFDAESPVVSVVRTTGTHSFSFPPPQAAPTPSTTSAPDSTNQPNLMTTTAFARQISPQPQASVTTTVNPSFSSTRTQPINQTHAQEAQTVSASVTTPDSFASTTTTPDEASVDARSAPTTLRSAGEPTTQSPPRRSRQQEVASGRSPSSRQSQRRRQSLARSGSFESTRISANQTQTRQADVSIVMRRQASNDRRPQEQEARDHRTWSSMVNSLVPAKFDFLIASNSKRRV